MARLPATLAVGLLLAGLATAAEPRVVSQAYLPLVPCCTLGGFEPDDVSVRVVVRDAAGPLVVVAALAVVHDEGHVLLAPDLDLCPGSHPIAVPHGADHVHVYFDDPATAQGRCGLGAGVATTGAVELRLNGA